MKQSFNHNLDALVGHSVTDEETRDNLLRLYPDMDIPLEICRTPKFVPHVLKQMERQNFKTLQETTNPMTNKLFTMEEAREEAMRTVKNSHSRYTTLLDAYKKREGGAS